MSKPQVNEFAKSLGVEIMSFGDGKSELSLTVDKSMMNKGGSVNGGILSALLDYSLGAALVSSLKIEEWCATTSLNINFLNPSFSNSKLFANGIVEKRGKNVAFCSGCVIDQSGKTIAKATGTWAVWETKPKKFD
tara:strand:+ start:73 stop:477 length:405 start_codon:yes stop_codon:yes gene_type:complete